MMYTIFHRLGGRVTILKAWSQTCELCQDEHYHVKARHTTHPRAQITVIENGCQFDLCSDGGLSTIIEACEVAKECES